ncbi:MAG: hypothetical protein AB7S69_09365 [Salinivirgaceae bacterium]
MNKKITNSKHLILSGILIVLVSVFGNTFAQESNPFDFVNAEKELLVLADELLQVRFDDELLDSLNLKLEKKLKYTLEQQNAFDYPFDSLSAISQLVSDDKLLRIFTWHRVKANGTHHHSGFIQYYHKPKKEVLLFQLNDFSDSIPEPANQTLSYDYWFGATYYDMVSVEINGETNYTLIGWDGNDLHSNKKVIDLLYFSANGKPRFGKPVFVADRYRSKRIVFEYSRMATMMVKWEAGRKQIVFDHLAPTEPVYQGNHKFYGPDLSYDAFEFREGLWHYVSAIDYKMEAPKKKYFR